MSPIAAATLAPKVGLNIIKEFHCFPYCKLEEIKEKELSFKTWHSERLPIFCNFPPNIWNMALLILFPETINLDWDSNWYLVTHCVKNSVSHFSNSEMQQHGACICFG